MNITRRFIPAVFVGGWAGACTLRWLSLDFLYRLMPDYWSGIGSSIAAVSALSFIVSLIILLFLVPIDKIGSRIQKTGEIYDCDRAAVMAAYKRTSAAIIVENIIGFIIGQFIVMMMDVKNGVVPYQLSRLVIIMMQAVCVGTIVALYELYYLDSLFSACRKMLQIHSMSVFKSVHLHSVSSRILLITAVTLIFMGLNAFTCGYAFICGDNIPEGADTLGMYIRAGIRCVFVVFAECVGLMFIVVSEMKQRLAATRGIVSELRTTGDLSRRINISMTDDIGSLISDLNSFMDRLASMITNLHSETDMVLSSADTLSLSSEKSLNALDVMKESVNKIGAEDKTTNEVIRKTYSDIRILKDNAGMVEQLVLVQSGSIGQTSAAMNQLAGNITSIAQTAHTADEVSEELRQASRQGSLAIETAQNAVGMIQEAAEEIKGIIMMIKRISGQTNLLSMNASIEAAHAGSYGAGFAVVALEVRSLANTSAENARTIEMHMKGMSEKITNGVAAMQKAGDAFALIDAGIEHTAEIVRRITLETEEQRSGTDDMLKATHDIVDAIDSIKELTGSLREHTENVLESTRNIVSSSQSISSALSRTADAVTNLDDAVVSVNRCASDNTVSVKKMKKHIDEYKTE